jgi:excisionase family DNA binding protein
VDLRTAFDSDGFIDLFGCHESRLFRHPVSTAFSTHDTPPFNTAARYIETSSGTLYNQISNGTIPFRVIRIGRRGVRFDKLEIDEWINNQNQKFRWPNPMSRFYGAIYTHKRKNHMRRSKVKTGRP